MKTLLITQDFAPFTGGVANYYLNRVNQMQSSEIVVLMNKVSGYQKVELKNKIYFENFFTKLIWPHWLPLIFHICKVIKKENPDMLWVGQILPVGTVIYFLSKIFRSKYFVTCHGNDLLRAKKISRKFKLAKKILNKAEYIEANTKFTQQILHNDFDISLEKIKIVYPKNVLSREQVDSKRVEELKNKHSLDNQKVLLTVTRLVKSKGIDHIIQALPKVLEQIPDLKYLVVGDGEEKEKLEKLIDEFSLKKNIIFIGQVEHSNLPNYYSLADCFILIPRNKQGIDQESFGIVYLEAQEFNLPIIASDVGGIKEAIKDYSNTSFVDPENIQEISNQIIKMLK